MNETTVPEKPRRLSALNAAAATLHAIGRPARCGELIQLMSEHGAWESPNGKTPEIALHSAISREIKTKGAKSRFVKISRGLFALAGSNAARDAAGYAAEHTPGSALVEGGGP